MKVLVLNYEFPPMGGGAAPVSKDISLQLSKKEQDVTVVTMGYEDLPAYEEIKGIKVYRLKCLRSRKSSCKPWEQYSYLLAVRSFMKKHMLTQHYDVCHTHFVIPTGEAAKWIKRKYRIPYIITAHGSDVEGHNQKTTMKIMHRILRSGWRKIVDESYAVVSPSEYLMDLMKRNYLCDKYAYIPNGIEWDKWHQCGKPEYKQNKILIMGRLQKFKNVQMILCALNLVDLGDWQGEILGDGPYRQELEELSFELGLSDRVHFRGWIDNGTEEQIRFVKEASLYISASQFENCPMSVIETAAAGCYPLLSDIPAHRQLIAEDVFFFKLDDLERLAEKMQKVITDRKQGIENIAGISRFDWKNIIQQYEALLYRASEAGMN